MPQYKNVLNLKRRALRNRMSRRRSHPLAQNPEHLEILSGDNINTRNMSTSSSNSSNVRVTKNESVSDKEFVGARVFLKNWAIQFGITVNALNKLLEFLQSNGFPYLPKNARTLLETPLTRNVISVKPGQYVYFGITENLNRALENEIIKPEELQLDFNIDGVPISKSTQNSFWVIMGRIYNLENSKIFIVAVYHGYQKPNNFNEILRPFVNELKELSTYYIFKDEEINVKIRSFILDAPARCSCLGIKSHNAYFGCTKCVQEGSFINNRMVFLEQDAQLRTNNSFRNRIDEHYHKEDSILEELDIDIIKQFPLDYLHVLLLGVVKRLIRMWISGNTRSLLSHRDVTIINNKFRTIAINQPSEFQRKARSLSEFGYFKGTEFRTIIKFTGPVVLKNILSPEKYNNFLLLHVATVILCDSDLCITYNNVAKIMLLNFVSGIAEIYGEEHIVYTMHSLLHLPEDVKTYGNLDEFSAFPFENYMSTIKKLLRKKNQQLSQISNRLAEINSIQINAQNQPRNTSVLLKKRKKILQETGRENFIFNEINFKNYKINTNSKNQWFLTKKKEIVRFQYAYKRFGTIFVQGQELKRKTNFYSIPIESKNLDIFQASNRESSPKSWHYEDIHKKLFGMQLEDENMVFFPL